MNPPLYYIKAKDPNGDFVSSFWSTEHFPRIGECVQLPENPEPRTGDWQDMTVEDITHPPLGQVPDVWLGGSDGWPEGSVAKLFANAIEYRTRVSENLRAALLAQREREVGK